MKAPTEIFNVCNFKRFDNDSFRDDIQKILMDQIRSFWGCEHIVALVEDIFPGYPK